MRRRLPAVAPADRLQLACSGSSPRVEVGPPGVASSGWPRSHCCVGVMGWWHRRQVQPCWRMTAAQRLRRLVCALRMPVMVVECAGRGVVWVGGVEGRAWRWCGGASRSRVLWLGSVCWVCLTTAVLVRGFSRASAPCGARGSGGPRSVLLLYFLYRGWAGDPLGGQIPTPYRGSDSHPLLPALRGSDSHPLNWLFWWSSPGLSTG